MKVGLGAPVSGAWATPENLAGFAARAEELGYDSLWTFQRLLVGVADELDPVYQSVLDPLLALTFAAAHLADPARGRAGHHAVRLAGPPRQAGRDPRRARQGQARLSRSATDLDPIAGDIAVVRAAAPDPSTVRTVVRGVVRPGPRTGRLSGSYDDILADTRWLAEQGVTELYYDLNWEPRIGDPTAPPAEASSLASAIAEALAPRWRDVT